MGDSTETTAEIAAAKRQQAISGVVDASSDAARVGAEGMLVVGEGDPSDKAPKGRRASRPESTTAAE